MIGPEANACRFCGWDLRPGANYCRLCEAERAKLQHLRKQRARRRPQLRAIELDEEVPF